MNLRLNYTTPMSRANGPGLRYTIWVQGCSIHCPGCLNLDTWDPRAGYEVSVDDLIEKINCVPGLDGITITGGEPLDQFESVYELCSKIFKKKSIFLTTGYTFEQLQPKGFIKIMDVLDLLCAGPFEKDKICQGRWAGSANQVVMGLTQIGLEQLKMPVISKETIIDKSGKIITTGFNPCIGHGLF